MTTLIGQSYRAFVSEVGISMVRCHFLLISNHFRKSFLFSIFCLKLYNQI
jgi:hypothetical protein